MKDEKSRTQQKKEMLALEKLGLKLTKLPPNKLNELGLFAELQTAFSELKEMKKHEAVRRQRQRIGVLMRRFSPQEIEELIQKCKNNTANKIAPNETQPNDTIQKLQSGLINGDPTSLNTVSQFTNLDRQRLRTLIRNAQKETKLNTTAEDNKQTFHHTKRLQTYLQELANFSKTETDL